MVGVSAAVPENCAGSLQMLSSQYIQERLAYVTKSRIDALEWNDQALRSNKT
jgi:hypothetical protein